MSTQNNNKGHRQRLRNKFLKSGLEGFHDYKIIELLLTIGTPRKDCKQPAKNSLKKFGFLKAVLETDSKELKEATQSIDVSVHDHLIIAGNDVYSFADHGIL